MANKLIEKKLTDVETFLKTNLGAELTALQAAYADNVDLDAPRTTDDGYAIYEKEYIDQLPFIQILPDNSDNEHLGVQHDIMDHSIIIVAHTPGEEGCPKDCALRTYRFAEAIWRIITNNRVLTTMEIWVNNIDYKPMMEDEDSRALKGEVWIHCTIKENEVV